MMSGWDWCWSWSWSECWSGPPDSALDRLVMVHGFKMIFGIPQRVPLQHRQRAPSRDAPCVAASARPRRRRRPRAPRSPVLLLLGMRRFFPYSSPCLLRHAPPQSSPTCPRPLDALTSPAASAVTCNRTPESAACVSAFAISTDDDDDDDEEEGAVARAPSSPAREWRSLTSSERRCQLTHLVGEM